MIDWPCFHHNLLVINNPVNSQFSVDCTTSLTSTTSVVRHKLLYNVVGWSTPGEVVLLQNHTSCGDETLNIFICTRTS